MNPYEQFQLSEELENNWDNKELQDRIIELEEESQKLKKKIEVLQANY